MARTRRWTERRVERLDRLGVDLQGEDAESLVQAAFCAILEGEEPWDPERYPLAGYVYQVVRSRTSKMASRGRPSPMALEDLDEQQISEALERDGAEGEALPSDQLDRARARDEAATLVLELRRLCAGDPDVQRVIDALSDGAASAADIAYAAGFSRERYRAARGRLDRLIKRIPSEGLAATESRPAAMTHTRRSPARRCRNPSAADVMSARRARVFRARSQELEPRRTTATSNSGPSPVANWAAIASSRGGNRDEV